MSRLQLRCEGVRNRRAGLVPRTVSCASGRIMDAISTRRIFLGVEQSATGRVWRDRLDERGNLRALSIVQRHGLPELLARIVAGRGIEPDDIEAYLDPTIKRLMPDPSTLTAMDVAAARMADAVTRREPIA